MIKEKAKIILVIVLIFQLITPFTFLIYQNYVNKYLEKETEYIKLNIDSVSINHDSKLSIKFSEYYFDEYEHHNYIIFEKSLNNEYSEIKFSDEKPETNNYLEYYNFYNLMNYETDDPYGIYEKYGSLNLYNKYYELDNVLVGYSDAPLTEAYALIGVYKNKFKINKIYINGYTFEEYLNLYENEKTDLLRYHNFPWDEVHTLDEYYKLIDEDKIKYYQRNLFHY